LHEQFDNAFGLSLLFQGAQFGNALGTNWQSIAISRELAASNSAI